MNDLDEFLKLPIAVSYEVIKAYPEMKWRLGQIINLRLGSDQRFSEPYAYTEENGAVSEHEFSSWSEFFKLIKSDNGK